MDSFTPFTRVLSSCLYSQPFGLMRVWLCWNQIGDSALTPYVCSGIHFFSMLFLRSRFLLRNLRRVDCWCVCINKIITLSALFPAQLTMRIFSPGYLNEFDNFIGQIRQKPNKQKAPGTSFEAKISKIRSRFFRWIVKPIIVVATCTYGLHLYNQHVQNTWINSTINVYELKQKVLWEARWLLFKALLNGELDTAKPMVFYAQRMNNIANHLENGAQTQPKILHREVFSAIDTWIFKWNVVTSQRLVNKRGDLVDEVKFSKLRLFGIDIWSNVESKILKPYKKIESKRKALWGLIQTEAESLNLVDDLSYLRFPKFIGQPKPIEAQLAFTVTNSASDRLNKLLAEVAQQEADKI